MNYQEIKLAEESGMTTLGENEDGEQEYMGTKKQWNKFDKMVLVCENCYSFHNNKLEKESIKEVGLCINCGKEKFK